jgi:uncharacterized membrane protein required for colicin V production
VEILGKLNFIDLGIIILLAAGAFAGFTQGAIRYLLGWVAVVVAFVLAAQLKGPMTDLLSFWQAFTRDVREFWIFIVLFVGFTIAGWFVVRAFYKATRLPVARQLDEVAGALLGILFAATFIVFQLLVFDTMFRDPLAQLPPGQTDGLRAYWQAMNDSVLVDFFRTTIIPTVGAVVRPFVPGEIARFITLR